MTSVLVKELRGPQHCTVSAVAPGPTATDLFLKGKPQAVIDHLAEAGAPGAVRVEPNDIARAVSFTCGVRTGAWINGQVLRANGGII